MKTVLFLITILSTSCIWSQTIKSKSTKRDYFKVTIQFENTNFDSLKLSHYVSSENGSVPDLKRDLPKKYSFKVRNGEYHTIWVTNDIIKKGLFIEGSESRREFDIKLDLLNPDVLNVYWNLEQKEYYISRLNYQELMNSFETE